MSWLSGSCISAFLGRVWKLPPKRKNMTLSVTRSYRLPLRYVPVFQFDRTVELPAPIQLLFFFYIEPCTVAYFSEWKCGIDFGYGKASPPLPFSISCQEWERKGLCWQIEHEMEIRVMKNRKKQWQSLSFGSSPVDFLIEVFCPSQVYLFWY